MYGWTFPFLSRNSEINRDLVHVSSSCLVSTGKLQAFQVFSISDLSLALITKLSFEDWLLFTRLRHLSGNMYANIWLKSILAWGLSFVFSQHLVELSFYAFQWDLWGIHSPFTKIQTVSLLFMAHASSAQYEIHEKQMQWLSFFNIS